MAALAETRLAELLQPYLLAVAPPRDLFSKLGSYLELLLRWNSRTNLTAIREPEEIVRRHFGESLFAGMRLREVLKPGATLLDFGSGAGFPGVPIQLLLPKLHCCLAESQGKKASFLREVIRTLEIPTEVWAARVETMPPERVFDCVTLRAVDRMGAAVQTATERVGAAGYLAVLGTERSVEAEVGSGAIPDWASSEFPIPGSESGRVSLFKRI